MSKKIYKSLFATILFFIFMNSIFFVKAETYLNISPVVQVISYYDVYGKYPMMMGWGSASIITNDGVIISNDHVVDTGNGSLASAFSVCITKEIGKKPICDYTASLIARDEKLDISILKIDSIDIYGKNVDYSKFKTIEIDYNYFPQNQDETIAVGYPWIGADTISETKGIVSGISEYNGYNYIKTDTLIAGGNSGGAFVRNGKLIGVPTFGIGWGDSMGYALDIKEAKSFIETNKNNPANINPITSIIDFNSYRKTIESFNSSLVIKDDIFNIKIPNDYQVSNYIKNTILNIELKKQKDDGVSLLNISIEKSPKLDTDKKKFYYFETLGFYYKDYQKLLKQNISGIDFYYPVDKTDLSSGDSSWGKDYKAVVGNHIISITLQAPLYDEKRNKEVKKEIEKLLSGIKLNTNNLKKVNPTFSTNIPKIDINNFPKTIANTGKYRFYLSDNLYEYVDFYLNELVEYNGKGKSAQEIFDVQLKDIDISLKSMIKFKGLDGFINCSGLSGIYSYYNYYNYYYYGNPYLDENGNYIELESCEINIFFPYNEELNRHNYLSITMKSLKNNKSKNLDLLIAFINNYLNVYTNSDETNITNIFKDNSNLNFTDIQNQSKSYKNFLSLLVRYNMIQNTNKFEGDSIINWGDYLDMYTKWVFNYNTDNKKCQEKDYKCKFLNYEIIINNKKTNLDKIFEELGIDDYKSYIDSSKIYDFDKIIIYKLSGIDLKPFHYSKIAEFEKNINEEKYQKEKKTLEKFINDIYGTKRILISNFYTNYDTYYYTNNSLTYYPNLDILKTKNTYEDEQISFSSKQSKKEKEFSDLYKNNNCNTKKTYLEFYNCNQEFEKKYNELLEKYNEINSGLYNVEEYEYSINPLTKAQAIEKIFSIVDFGLFDEELAKKKDTIVE